ncbi:MAG: spore photoproduct lyase family protein, partial [Pseudomonadota bacterium]
MKPAIRQLFVDLRVQDTPLARDIRQRLAGVPVELVDGPGEVFRHVLSLPDPVAAAKSVLYITRNQGRFIRPCPGTSEYTCCGYTILHVGTFCPMDCAYCVLQTYFHPPVMQLFANQDELFSELDQVLKARDPATRRMGTGEFTDSLVWESLWDLTPRLVERFAAQDHAVLELKTKTVNIDALKGLDHRGKTILAWSMNAPRVVREHEKGATSLSARLSAAARCAEWGYPLAFHFDPLVPYPGCEKDYREVVREVFARVPSERVVWISLGTLRYPPSLGQMIRERRPGSELVLGEMVPGLDNKMRVFKPIRMALCREMVEEIQAVAPEVTAYFCMEDQEVWERCMGFWPGEKGLSAY